MKINEKHLISFAVGTAAVDKQGYLNKRGESNRSFQRRWFVLKGNLLFYFDKKTDAEPVGVIILEGCSIELSENSENFAFELNFAVSSSRTYILAAETQEEMEDWMRALTCASYIYIRNAVSDLQRQLDVWNATHRSSCSSLAEGELVACETVPYKGNERVNPFNINMEEPLDVFPASSFDDKSDRCHRPRTFEEMHYDFGERIVPAVIAFCTKTE